MQLAKELREFEQYQQERKDLKGMLTISESTYLAKYLPAPTKKTIHNIKPPSKKPLQKRFRTIGIVAIIVAIMLIFVISSYVKMAMYDNVREKPGEEYEAWLNSYPNATTDEQLEEGWEAVEKAWKKRGVTIDWDYIKEEIAGHYIIRDADDFDSAMRKELYDKWYGYNTKASYVVFPTLIAIAVLVFLVRGIKKIKESYKQEIETNKKLKRENEANQKYNDTVYPGLVEAREKKLPEIRAQYAKEIANVREKLKLVEMLLEMKADILPEYYHKNAGDIAEILERGRADSLKEAINIFEDDKRAAAEAARRAAEERYRAEQEERHRRQMEEEARRAADAAEKAAKAAQASATASATRTTQTTTSEPPKFVRFYHFKGNPDYVGVNVISNENNVYAAKRLMMITYGKTEADLNWTSSEKPGAPYFDGRNAH